jgi:hypothetical protein
MKSRNDQIWIFWLGDFNLVHSTSLNHIWSFWDWKPGHQMFTKFIFSPSSRPIYKNIHRLCGSGPTTSIYLDSHLPRPVKFVVGFPSPRKWGPFEIYLPATWNVVNQMWLRLELWTRFKPSNRSFQISGLHVAMWKLNFFLSVVHGDSRPVGALKSMSPFSGGSNLP